MFLPFVRRSGCCSRAELAASASAANRVGFGPLNWPSSVLAVASFHLASSSVAAPLDMSLASLRIERAVAGSDCSTSSRFPVSWP